MWVRSVGLYMYDYRIQKEVIFCICITVFMKHILSYVNFKYCGVYPGCIDKRTC